MKRIILLLSLVVLSASCIEDLSKYDYKKTNEVTYKSVNEGYTFTSGDQASMVAPVEFSETFANEADIDKKFEINWYLNEELVATGYRISYTFKKVGGFSLIIKITNRETGEVYISDNYTVHAKSAIGWGWMLLCDYGTGNSSLSFIAPNTYFASHKLEDLMDLPEPLGQGPKSLNYYYVLGSIPNNYVSGLPKIVLNQQSGTVTLDGRNLMKDKMMADEFLAGAEPESDFTMSGFAWKGNYYLIATPQGNVYVKAFEREYDEIPFYGTYASMPFNFEGGANITYFQGFQNVTFWTANSDKALMYDSLNDRFLVFVPGGYGTDYETYSPKVVYLSHYDETAEFEASVPKVNELPQGTRCLAAGAYEIVAPDESGYGQTTYPNYVTLIDLGGTGNYQVYTFEAKTLGYANHIITQNTMTAFTGSTVMTDKSVVLMSTNFEKNPYFYFTDGGKNFYVYSMATKSHVLAYTAGSRITHLCGSPIVCEFKDYGGNSEAVNWRMALVQENGDVDIIDVATDNMIKAFEGRNPDLHLKSLSGFGDVKDIVWATNFEGEY